MLCLGNPLIADDGMGPAVADELRRRRVAADVAESSLAGLGLLDDLLGVDRLVVVDTVETGAGPPGTLRVVSGDEVEAGPAGWQHAMGLFESLSLARALGLDAPREVLLVAVEAGDLVSVGAPLTPPVRDRIPEVADLVEQMVRGGG